MLNGQGMWVLHKPENCNNKAAEEAANDTTTAESMANRAIADIQDESESEDESE